MWESLRLLITEIQQKLRTLPNTDQRFVDLWSVNAAPISGRNLAEAAEPILAQLEIANSLNLPASGGEQFQAMLVNVRDSYVPNLYGQPYSHMAILSTFQVLSGWVTNHVGHSEMVKLMSIPRSLSSQVASAGRNLQKTIGSIEGIDAKIAHINQANEAATNLPITIEELDSATKEIDRTRIAAAAELAACKDVLAAAVEALQEIKGHGDHASGIAARIDDSYRAVTSQGLAAAFKEREVALRESMRTWVLLLVAALGAAAFIGYERFPVILAALQGKPDWGVITADAVLAGLSLTAPIWFATVATKQISQRFRLSEDYGYKRQFPQLMKVIVQRPNASGTIFKPACSRLHLIDWTSSR